MTASSPLRLGLTGGIGSGKSTVAQMLAARGAAVIDSDAIARSVTAANGPAMPAIAEAFGKEFVTPDGALDRERMRALVFSDPSAKLRLEAIVHPLVGLATQAQAQAAIQAGHALLVFDVPLLVESPRWRKLVDQGTGRRLPRKHANCTGHGAQWFNKRRCSKHHPRASDARATIGSSGHHFATTRGLI